MSDQFKQISLSFTAQLCSSLWYLLLLFSRLYSTIHNYNYYRTIFLVITIKTTRMVGTKSYQQ